MIPKMMGVIAVAGGVTIGSAAYMISELVTERRIVEKQTENKPALMGGEKVTKVGKKLVYGTGYAVAGAALGAATPLIAARITGPLRGDFAGLFFANTSWSGNDSGSFCGLYFRGFKKIVFISRVFQNNLITNYLNTLLLLIFILFN